MTTMTQEAKPVAAPALRCKVCGREAVRKQVFCPEHLREWRNPWLAEGEDTLARELARLAGRG